MYLNQGENMAKAIPKIVIILVVIIVGCVVGAGLLFFQNQKTTQEKTKVIRKLKQTQAQKESLDSEIEKLKGDLSNIQAQKSDLERQLKSAEKKATELSSQVTEIKYEKDSWKRRAEDGKNEKRDLKDELQDLKRKRKTIENKLDKLESEAKKWEKKYREAKEEAREAARSAKLNTSSAAPVTTNITTSRRSSYNNTPKQYSSDSIEQDAHWADVLKDKASLEVELEKLNRELSKNAQEIVALKQSNDTLSIEVDTLRNSKEEIEREMKYKEDMITNLSIELARTKNDKKFISDTADKLNGENKELRKELKKLVASNGELEKLIYRVNDEKDKITQDLYKRENLIQAKIDEIWEIKDGLDQTFKSTKVKAPSSGLELPPILVSSDGGRKKSARDSHVGYNGKVVSINEANNFIVLDIGNKDGVKVGDKISVYRDSDYIANVEIIQVRQEISAADIKEQKAKIKVGDIVR